MELAQDTQNPPAVYMAMFSSSWLRDRKDLICSKVEGSNTVTEQRSALGRPVSRRSCPPNHMESVCFGEAYVPRLLPRESRIRVMGMNPLHSIANTGETYLMPLVENVEN